VTKSLFIHLTDDQVARTGMFDVTDNQRCLAAMGDHIAIMPQDWSSGPNIEEATQIVSAPAW
jgi:hypothetical protein